MDNIPKLGGQTISDRLVAAKHTVTGSGLAKAVCKASTEEPSGPKKKHLDYLTQCTNEINVSIPQLADLLIERTQNGNWVVVFKALVTIHHLMGYGNERFIQYLASCNSTFNLGNFLDKSGVAGYDMSPFIRRYSKYLNEKCIAYRQMALDFCKIKRGKDEGMMRKMEVDKLLKTLPVLQTQVDALLDFEVTADELRNGVINGAFLLLFKDLIRLFACYNDGIINLLEKYFDMNKKQCKEALELYKRFLVRVDRVSEFLKVAEQVGIDKGGIPDLAKAPSSLLEALEQHYNSMDEKGGKKCGRTTPAPNSGETVGSGAGGSGSTTPVINISEAEKKRLIAEEAARMEALKAEADSRLTSSALDLLTIESPAFDTSGRDSATTSPAIGVSQNGTCIDISTDSSNAVAATTAKPSDDLFALISTSSSVAPAGNNPFGSAGQSSFGTTPEPSANLFGPQNVATAASSNLFASDAQFNNAFPIGAQMSTVNPQSAPFDPFGEILQPAPVGSTASNASSVGNPFIENPNNNEIKTEKLIKGNNLEDSLKNLAGNLKINPGASTTKRDFNRSPISKRTGGADWSPMGPISSAATAAPLASGWAPAAGGPSPNLSFAAPTPAVSGIFSQPQSNFNPFDNGAQLQPASLGPFGAAPPVASHSPVLSPANQFGSFGASNPPNTTAPSQQSWGFQDPVPALQRNTNNPF